MLPALMIANPLVSPKGCNNMYAVIFHAEIDQLDTQYTEAAERMRNLARDYGCKEFISCLEGDAEIAISYWETEAQIKAWKQDIEHLAAQEKGRKHWYRSYRVQVTKIERQYQFNT